MCFVFPFFKINVIRESNCTVIGYVVYIDDIGHMIYMKIIFCANLFNKIICTNQDYYSV